MDWDRGSFPENFCSMLTLNEWKFCSWPIKNVKSCSIYFVRCRGWRTRQGWSATNRRDFLSLKAIMLHVSNTSLPSIEKLIFVTGLCVDVFKGDESLPLGRHFTSDEVMVWWRRNITNVLIRCFLSFVKTCTRVLDMLSTGSWQKQTWLALSTRLSCIPGIPGKGVISNRTACWKAC